jgi:hypothetical protein
MRAVTKLGGRIEPAGDKLRTLLPAGCPPELKSAIRQYKLELLNFFKAASMGVALDCVPWVHVARQILAGEFEDADRYLVESLTIGLKNILHTDCQRALAHLGSLRPTKKRKRNL